MFQTRRMDFLNRCGWFLTRILDRSGKFWFCTARKSVGRRPMNKTLFIITSVVIGIFIQVFLNHYIGLLGATPQAFLLFVVSLGFVTGPLMGQTVGFFGGLLMDAMGIRLFG